MTELLDAVTLHSLAQTISQPAPHSQRLVPVLHWSIDEATQKPVAQWTLVPNLAAIR